MLYTPSRCDALKWMWQDNMSYILNEVLGALTVSQDLSSPVSVNFHLFYKPAKEKCGYEEDSWSKESKLI